MKTIVLPRQGGKTTELVKWAAEDDHRIIIVHSEAEAHRLQRLYCSTDAGSDVGPWGSRLIDAPLATWQIVSVSEVVPGKTLPFQGVLRRDAVFREGHRRLEFAVDNVDLILQQLLNAYPITTITATGAP